MSPKWITSKERLSTTHFDYISYVNLVYAEKYSETVTDQEYDDDREENSCEGVTIFGVICPSFYDFDINAAIEEAYGDEGNNS